MKTYLFLQSVLFLSATVAVQAGPVVNQYFPMNNGDNRFYQDSANHSYTATEYFTQTTYNGHSVFSLNFHDDWDGYPYAQDTWYLGNNSGALALYGITTAWGSMSFNSPANLMTDQTITNNQILTSQVTGLCLGSTFNITIQTTVISIPGTVVVPAGTFSNCKLVLVAETATLGGIPFDNYDSAAWVLAPGAGIIADGVQMLDSPTGPWSSSDYLELISGKINNVPIDFTPPSNNLSGNQSNGYQWYVNPLFIWGTASDAGLGGSGIAQVTVNGSATSNDTVAGNGSAVWSTYTYLVPGTNTLKIIATDGAGNSTTNYLIVVEMLPAPTLTTQPTNQTVVQGANVSFSVIPASSLLSLSYQWRKDGAALNGATNSNYSITGVQTNQSGKYSVVVTNASGSLTSSNATLTVTIPLPPPPILFAKKQGTNMVFSWPTNATGYTLISSTNLGFSAVWITNLPLPVIVKGTNVVTNSMSGLRKFYRLKHP
ncbi:MAG TPA: immunoglobulin domain-containing protein [Verrucomicrobiae bacterium]